MTVDSDSGLVSWTPAAGSPSQATVIVQVSNARGGHALQQFSIATSGVNAPPVFDALAAQFQGQENQVLQIPVHATGRRGRIARLLGRQPAPGRGF